MSVIQLYRTDGKVEIMINRHGAIQFRSLPSPEGDPEEIVTLLKSDVVRVLELEGYKITPPEGSK